MEHEISTNTVLLNVGVQLVNLILFFLFFKYMFGGKIIGAMQERKELMNKLINADAEYATIISNAELAAKEIMSDAQAQKKNLVEEASLTAKHKANEIMELANNKAEELVSTAKIQAQTLEADLKNNYEVMVKTTAGSYLKKIFEREPKMQEAYLDKVSNGVLVD